LPVFADLKLPGLATLGGLANKIALELVFAEPGKDNGLLPINSLLGEMEATVSAEALPSGLTSGLSAARGLIDQVFIAGSFDAAPLRQLKEWCGWLENALAAADTDQPISACPLAAAAASPEAAGMHAPAPAPSVAAVPAAAPVAGALPAGLPPEQALTLNVDSDGELLREFVGESAEHLQNIELGVLTLEENPTDADTLNSIFRAFHTFKGGSGFLNLKPVNKLAHELESLLDLARQGKLTIDSQITNIILTGGDTLSQFVKEIGGQLDGSKPCGEILVPTQALLARIRVVIEAARAGRPAAPTVAPATLSAPAQAVVVPIPAPVGPVPEVPQVLPLPVVVPAPAEAAPVTGKPGGGGESAKGAAAGAAVASIKVDTGKLDSLIDLVGEMVIAQSMVAQDSNVTEIQSQQLTRNLAQLTRITRDLQRVSMSLRMVPIRGTFQKMARVVRDLSVKAGKQVQLEVDGEETELDRNIVEELNDPLVHMIRNSMDHGIEKTETRVAAGKSPQGTIRLRSFHQGGNIVIEVSDDGAGLNREKILNKAVEKGLAKPNQSLSDKEIFAFIFGAGFSTAERVTDISGRGVGMDVVRRNIEKLRGKIEIESVLGKGTKISIHLPLTLAIIDGLILMVAGQRFIVPTLSVRESFRPTAGMISTVHGKGELVNVRGHLMPLLRLHDLFDLPGAVTDPSQAIVLVVESDSRIRCLLVDQLVGKQEVVIKSLGETFRRNPGLAGAAILGDGRVGLILDIAGLMKLNASPLLAAA
jgi:two-component system chemotaxis sensor kinase CheA